VELSVARVIDLAFLVVVAWTFSLRTFWGIGMSVKSVVNLKFLSDCRFESLTRRTLECELASFFGGGGGGGRADTDFGGAGGGDRSRVGSLAFGGGGGTPPKN